MNAPSIVLVVLAVAFVASAWRTLRRGAGATWLRVLLAAISTVLLGLLLFPPDADRGTAHLRVLTPGASTIEPSALPTVALPGVEADVAIERVPDLGTALRRHAGVDAIEIVGDGLPPRDRDAASGMSLQFTPPQPPAGVVELDAPAHVAAGALWTLRGRLSGSGVRAELRDRADGLVARTDVDDQGRFALEASAKGDGATRYRLRALADDDRVIEEVPLVIDVRRGERLRIVVLAGAPDGELKYLRRWARDSGLDLASRIALSPDMALREGELRLDAESLRAADLVIVDERAWAALAASERESMLEAVDGGMGLLLRAAGPLSASVAKDWAGLGFSVRDADLDRMVTLTAAPAEGAAPARLVRRPLAVEEGGSAPLLATAAGEALARWRSRGRGRIALSWLVESYPLALAGEPARYGSLWSHVVSTLARARADAPPRWSGFARVDQRLAICRVGAEAFVEAPDGSRTPLVSDPVTPGCAAYWPAEAGVHALVDGEARWPFNVYAADEAQALARNETMQATQAMAETATTATPAVHRVAGPRWPWLLGWLAVTGWLWWLERRRT